MGIISLIAGVYMQFYTPTVLSKPFPKGDLRDSTNNYVVLHYDNGIESKNTFRFLQRKRNSYHYFIDRNGVVYKLIDPKYQARHAGISLWNGMFGMNKRSIGICLQNDGKSPYTDIQYKSLNWLLNTLYIRYPDLTREKVIGHSDVAFPRGRKFDPGPNFNWSRITVIIDVI